MQTSGFFVYSGTGRIVVSRGVPRGGVIGKGYKMFKALAPRREMLKMAIGPYRDIYFNEILAAFDPQETWDKLHELVSGTEPILLCFEAPPFTSSNWCHRRMIAEWFEDKLGYLVPEWEKPLVESDGQPVFAL